MHGAAVHDGLALDVLLQNGVDGGVDGGIIADADQDEVAVLDGFGDSGDSLGLGGAEFGGEVICALLGAVVEDQGLVEVPFGDEVGAHALGVAVSGVWSWWFVIN